MKLSICCIALILAPGLYAAPNAVAWSSPTAPYWTTALVPYPILGRPWDTSGNHTNQLVGTGSTGTGLSYLWTFISGPNTPTITSATSATTTVTGVIAGMYVMHLRVTDNMAAVSNVDLDVGAISIDSNNVVVQSDPNVAKLYGSMIALGYNPWGYQDERHVTTAMLQIANNPYYTTMGSVWGTTNASGTISYPFDGIGLYTGIGTQCTLNEPTTLAAAALTIHIHNSENCPSLATLPTWLFIGAGAGAGELVRIINTTATTGDATLTVGYNGRGLSDFAFVGVASTPVLNPGQIWADGTPLGDLRITGTSTLFATDATRPLCPAGVPGPAGPISYSTGTVRLAASSTLVTGGSTVWTDVNAQAAVNSMTGEATTGSFMIRVAATHGGGTPFVWWAQIMTLNTGAQTLVASRPAPSDVDTMTDFTYAITGARYLSLEFADPTYGGIHRVLYKALGCESETAAFAEPGYGIPVADGITQTSKHYSYKNSLGAGSAPFGPNFYGTDSALLSFYYRSGYTPALTASRQISDYWIRDPEFCGGYCLSSPLNLGGGFFGGAANIALNGSALSSITDMRPWASNAVTVFTAYHGSCNITLGPYDTRDQGYMQSYLTLTAMFDTGVGNFQTTWLPALGSTGSGTLQRDQVCKHADNSFAIGLMGNNAVIHMTSTLATASAVSLPYPGLNVYAVTAGSWSAGTATLTIGAHLITAGQTIGISGITPSGYNVDPVIVSGVTGTTISYPVVSNPGAWASGGSVRQGFQPNLCAGTASGTITVTNGSAVATLVTGSLGINPASPYGADPTENYNIVIRDTTSSPNYIGFFEFFFSGSTVALAGKWPGASGTFTFLVQNASQFPSLRGGGATVIAPDGTDTSNILMSESWACTFNSSNQITFNRPWTDAVVAGHSTGDYQLYVSALSGVGMGGYFQQPFMFGIKTKDVYWASKYINDSTVATGYQALLSPMGTWMHDNGYDISTKGVYYARVSLMCEPYTAPKTVGDAPGATIFVSIHGTNQQGGCGYSGMFGDPADGSGNTEFPERVNTPESFAAIIAYYRAQCLLGTSQCTTARAFGDEAYGAVWGDCTMTSGGGATFFCDTHFITGNELSNANLAAYKWPGFFFGVGGDGSYGWPAIRLEGLGTSGGHISSGKITLTGKIN